MDVFWFDLSEGVQGDSPRMGEGITNQGMFEQLCHFLPIYLGALNRKVLAVQSKIILNIIFEGENMLRYCSRSIFR